MILTLQDELSDAIKDGFDFSRAVGMLNMKAIINSGFVPAAVSTMLRFCGIVTKFRP